MSHFTDNGEQTTVAFNRKLLRANGKGTAIPTPQAKDF
jgi:hypothetical protein